MTFWVSPNGADNNRGTQDAPFATKQKAVNVAASYNYGGLYFPTVKVVDGDYNLGSSPLYLPPVIGAKTTFDRGGGDQSVTPLITGNTTTPGNIIVSGTGNSGSPRNLSIPLFYGLPGSGWAISGIQTDTPGTAYFASNGALLDLSNLNFTDTTNGGYILPMWGYIGSLILANYSNFSILPSGIVTLLLAQSEISIEGSTFTFPSGGCTMADT